MKFCINKSELFSLSALAQRAAASKDTVPLLSGLLIEADPKEGLVFSATDLETGIRTKTDKVDIIESGQALVNAQFFTNLVRYLPDTDITIHYDNINSKLVIYYGKSKANINTYNAKDFPRLSLDQTENYLSLEKKLLKDALRITSFAAASTHFKQVFTGTCFDCRENLITIVASDTHRLACKILSLGDKLDTPRQFIVPNRSINDLLRIMNDEDDIINIGFVENSVVFNMGDTYFTSRLLEGQYPNYEQVIPKDFISTVTLNPKTLVEILERTVIMPTDEKTIKKIQMETSISEIKITAFSEKVGEVKEVIEDHEITGQEHISIAFNTRYIMDVAKLIAAVSDKMILNLTGPLSPALVTSPELDNYRYVLVPLRTV